MKIDYWGLALLSLGLGCLQVVLDKGQQEDWFSSSFITVLTIVSVISLILFVFVEYYTKHPIIDLRIFRNISFSMGNIVVFIGFFNLLSSIVLLPIYLQSLMGYTAFLAGIVLGPGGIATIFALPIAGKLVNKVNPKALLAFGIITNGYATYLMSGFSLQADFATVIWPRVVLGIGMGFFFIPLTTLTIGAVKKEEMGNATAIFNLLRNLGGSFGVAFVTTVLARRAQFHQHHLVENLTPYDMPYQMGVEQAGKVLTYRGLPEPLADAAGLGAMYKELIRQATMIAFNDAFLLTCIIMFTILPLVLLMRRPRFTRQTGVH